MKNLFGFSRSKSQKNANKFEIADPQSKNSLVQFERIDTINYDEWLEIPPHYYPDWNKDITISFAGHAAGVAAQAGGIAALVPNGLYTATVHPSLLMSYANGTLGSSVMGANGIVTHAGFTSAASAVFAPILIFQVLSLITGRYYMNGISRQLSVIDRKLREIIELYHVERLAKLRFYNKVFRELSVRKVINVEDMVQFQNAMAEIGVIHEEYAEQLDRSDGEGFRNITEHFWTADRSRELSNKINIDNYEYKLKIAILADELYHLGKIIELHLNSKMKDNRETRWLRVAELLEEIKGWNESNFYFNRIGDKKIEEYYQEIIATAKQIYYDAVFHDDDIDRIKRNYEEKYSNLQAEIGDRSREKADNLLQISKKIIHDLESPKQIIMAKQEDGGIKLLIKREEIH